jgi:peroxiredoxin
MGESAETVESFVQEQRLTFPSLLDTTRTVSREYRIRGIPTSFFIDREGVIVDQHVGPMDLALIEQYLGEIE